MTTISKAELKEGVTTSIGDLHNDSDNEVKIANGTYEVTADKVEDQLMKYMSYYDYDINVNDKELNDIVVAELYNYNEEQQYREEVQNV